MHGGSLWFTVSPDISIHIIHVSFIFTTTTLLPFSLLPLSLPPSLYPTPSLPLSHSLPLPHSLPPSTPPSITQWEVAGLSLAILHKLLTSHEISPGDFTDQSYELPGGGVGTVPKPPGHTLLIHMMNDSQLLRKVRLVPLPFNH